MWRQMAGCGAVSDRNLDRRDPESGLSDFAGSRRFGSFRDPHSNFSLGPTCAIPASVDPGTLAASIGRGRHRPNTIDALGRT